MCDIKPIETVYNGYRFRSRLEARWAVFFDALGIEYEYEPEGFNKNNTYYLPDFYLPSFGVYFEVKRKGLPKSEKKKIGEMIKGLCDGGGFAELVAFGDPEDDDLTIFCQEVDDGGGGNYSAEVVIGVHPLKKQPYLLSYNDRRERTFLVSWCSDVDDDISMVTCEYGEYKYEDFINDRVKNARLISRQARFEYGETPKAEKSNNIKEDN